VSLVSSSSLFGAGNRVGDCAWSVSSFSASVLINDVVISRYVFVCLLVEFVKIMFGQMSKPDAKVHTFSSNLSDHSYYLSPFVHCVNLLDISLMNTAQPGGGLILQKFHGCAN